MQHTAYLECWQIETHCSLLQSQVVTTEVNTCSSFSSVSITKQETSHQASLPLNGQILQNKAYRPNAHLLTP